MFKKSFDNLLEITNGCRSDMHEPDEQGLTAIVTGLKLDNTDGNQRQIYRTNPEAEEIIITLRRIWDEEGTYSQVEINLATLIALARRATFAPTYTDEDMKQARKEGFEQGFERGGGDWSKFEENLSDPR